MFLLYFQHLGFDHLYIISFAIVTGYVFSLLWGDDNRLEWVFAGCILSHCLILTSCWKWIKITNEQTANSLLMVSSIYFLKFLHDTNVCQTLSLKNLSSWQPKWKKYGLTSDLYCYVKKISDDKMILLLNESFISIWRLFSSSNDQCCLLQNILCGQICDTAVAHLCKSSALLSILLTELWSTTLHDSHCRNSSVPPYSLQRQSSMTSLGT